MQSVNSSFAMLRCTKRNLATDLRDCHFPDGRTERSRLDHPCRTVRPGDFLRSVTVTHRRSCLEAFRNVCAVCGRRSGKRVLIRFRALSSPVSSKCLRTFRLRKRPGRHPGPGPLNSGRRSEALRYRSPDRRRTGCWIGSRPGPEAKSERQRRKILQSYWSLACAADGGSWKAGRKYVLFG